MLAASKAPSSQQIIHLPITQLPSSWQSTHTPLLAPPPAALRRLSPAANRELQNQSKQTEKQTEEWFLLTSSGLSKQTRHCSTVQSTHRAGGTMVQLGYTEVLCSSAHNSAETDQMQTS